MMMIACKARRLDFAVGSAVFRTITEVFSKQHWNPEESWITESSLRSNWTPESRILYESFAHANNTMSIELIIVTLFQEKQRVKSFYYQIGS